jgi:hypothetical protein
MISLPGSELIFVSALYKIKYFTFYLPHSFFKMVKILTDGVAYRLPENHTTLLQIFKEPILTDVGGAA